jgi:hypothetical protein
MRVQDFRRLAKAVTQRDNEQVLEQIQFRVIQLYGNILLEGDGFGTFGWWRPDEV